MQILAQGFHTLGAVALIFGFFGLYLKYRSDIGTMGFIGFVLTILGGIGFVVDGLIGLVISPALAVDAPATIAADGTLFIGATLIMYIIIFIINMIGQLLLGISLLRKTQISRVAVLLFIVGAVMANLPPLPALHFVLVAGGVLGGIAEILFGLNLLNNSSN